MRPPRRWRGLAWAPALALALTLVLAGAWAAQPAPETGQQWAKVGFINDGDTITVYWQGRRELVRLLGVDAPETWHSRKLERAAARARRAPAEEARLGEQARQAVMGLLAKGDQVRLEEDPGAGWRDDYGRLLAYVYLEDGRQLNEWLVEQGYAQVFHHCRCRLKKRFTALERQARAQGRGLWAQGGP